MVRNFLDYIIKGRKEIKIENYGFLRLKENIEIKIIDFIFSIDSFYNKNGIEFLIFQLHNISNIIIGDNNNNDNINLFNNYIDFYDIHKYFTHRNIILSLLLDDSIFHQNIVLKQGKILIHLMAIVKNKYNFREEIFNEEILYKIFNLDFILESKEYHHKLYMKLIMSLLLIKDNKMIYEKASQYIFHLNNEIKLYHYLKYIYINLDSL